MLKRIFAAAITCVLFFSGCSFTSEKNNDNEESSSSIENSSDEDTNNKDENKLSLGDILGINDKESENKEDTSKNEGETENKDNNNVLNSDKSSSSSTQHTLSKENIGSSSSSSSTNLSGHSTNSNKEYSVISDSSLSTQWDIIDTVVDAAQDYYSENFNKTRLVSMNGYFYNYASNEIIDVEYLVREGLLSSKYLNKGCEILLLDADEMKKYDTLDIKPSETGLTVFASVRNPKDNTKLIATNRSAGGYLTSSQYAALLNSYYQNHGSIGTLYSGSEEYDRIISFISMYEGRYDDYFVRSIIRDNKYAFVTLSTENNTANVKQYILRKSGNIWEVVMDGIENESRTSVAVNKKIPDFNLDMLPNYNISDYINSINSYNLDLINILKSDGNISSDSEIKYISSVRDFGYVVLTNETKFLFTQSGGSWRKEQVASSSDAVRKMESQRSAAPTFIVLDS